MNSNPYAPPARTNTEVIGWFANRAVHCCVGLASLIYALWLAPAVYHVLRGAGLEFVKQNQAVLFTMTFAALVGGIATIRVQRHRTWLPILVVWVPMAMYPVSLAIYTSWSAGWEWYGILVLPVLLFAVAASPFAYARKGSPGQDAHERTTIA